MLNSDIFKEKQVQIKQKSDNNFKKRWGVYVDRKKKRVQYEKYKGPSDYYYNSSSESEILSEEESNSNSNQLIT